LLTQMCGLLEKGESFVLATILNHQGSTPRSSGARMLIREGGQIMGTIGGGLLEAQVISRAPSVFEDRRTCVAHHALNADMADSMDMICGGTLSVLLEFITADQNNRKWFGRLNQMASENMAGLVVTPVPDTDGRQELPSGKFLLGPDGSIAVKKSASFPDAPALFAAYRHLRRPALVRLGQQKFYIEPIGNQECLYLFGAGHVSQRVARFAHTVGFKVVVVDDRSEFANRKRFGEVDEILVPQSYANSFQTLTIDRNSYLVIVTRGHLHDRLVLAKALRTKAGYIGMIGSKRKRDAIYESLLKDGYQPFDIERVHSPIGLDIDAETPEEIAVSIVSELIASRAFLRKNPSVNTLSPAMDILLT